MSKYKFPEIRRYDYANPQERARISCLMVECVETPSCCKCCIFNNDLWTPEREAAFLEWESNQSKGE